MGSASKNKKSTDLNKDASLLLREWKIREIESTNIFKKKFQKN